jgi:hypothetical protein
LPPKSLISFSQLRHRLNISRRYAVASFKSLTDSADFQNIKTMCLFIGNPRSGHTLVGSLIDAHHSALIADEMDVAKYLPITPSREHLFWMIKQNSFEAAQAGRNREEYSYKVPNQWQGRYDKLSIIGDKKGGRTAWAFGTHPEEYERLKRLVKIPIKFIHVIRNPYDNITTMTHRRELTRLAPMIQGYFENCDKVAIIKKVAGDGAVLDIRQEDLIKDPTTTLQTVCGFLELETDDGYLRDCTSILFQSPKRTRASIAWSPSEISEVAQRIERYSFLHGYNFEN